MTKPEPEEFHDESGLFDLQPLPDSTIAALLQATKELADREGGVSVADLLALKSAAQRDEDAGVLDLNALMNSVVDAVDQPASDEDVDLEALWDLEARDES